MPIFLFTFFVLIVIYILLIDYYQRSWQQLPEYENNNTIPSTMLSVVIAVRNERENIHALLESLHQQTYPKNLFEIIIVDDHSTDGTWKILQQNQYTDISVRCFRLEDHVSGQEKISSYKKKAIETGVANAKGDLIITTDADCRFPRDWLLTLSSFYESKKAKFIAAPVKITNRFSFLAIFETLDFITLQGITGASVYRRFHSMCNGANLAYEKQAFVEVNGFEGINHVASGDDMLLMHKIRKRYPDKVFYLKSKAATVLTGPASSWKKFFNQRIRWASKADSYQDRKVFWVLLLVYLVNVCFLILGVAAFFSKIWLFFFLMLLLSKILIEFPFVRSVTSFFNQQRLMKYFILVQPLHILYIIITGGWGKLGSYEWKDRRIKK